MGIPIFIIIFFFFWGGGGGEEIKKNFIRRPFLEGEKIINFFIFTPVFLVKESKHFIFMPFFFWGGGGEKRKNFLSSRPCLEEKK